MLHRDRERSSFLARAASVSLALSGCSGSGSAALASFGELEIVATVDEHGEVIAVRAVRDSGSVPVSTGQVLVRWAIDRADFIRSTG